MDNIGIGSIIESILEDRKVPRNIRLCVKESLDMLSINCSPEEKISCVISALDEANSDPNVPMHARTAIWSFVSALEGMKNGF